MLEFFILVKKDGTYRSYENFDKCFQDIFDPAILSFK